VLQPDQHLLEEGVQQVGVAGTGVEHDTDDVGAATNEGARGCAWGVVQLLREREDLGARRLAHLR
jgi:hypothetical protein